MFQFIGSVFNALIGRPIVNLLLIIIAFLPGHNLGVAIIIFTILIRLVLYPLLKKQLHHTMAMRNLQPDIKRIKKEASGDKQKEYAMMMELYKQKEIKPMASIGILFAQLPILLALFHAINDIVKDPGILLDKAYFWVKGLPFMEQLAMDASKLDTSLFGIVDLTRNASTQTGIYWPAMVLVVASVVVQYYQSKQLTMTDKNTRSLRQILKDTSAGKEVDQSEVQAATSKFTLYLIPFMLLIFAINLPAALSLYWLVGSLVAIYQQKRILRQDVVEMQAEVNGAPVEATLVKIDPKTKVKTYVKNAEILEKSSSNNTNTNTSKKTAKKRPKSRKKKR